MLPAIARARPARVVEALLATAPFVLAAARAAPDAAALPWAALAGAAALGLLATASPPGARRVLAIGAACAVGLPLAAHAVGAGPRPPWAVLAPPSAVALAAEPVPEAWTEAAGADRRRVGALARVPEPAPADGPGWMPVPAGARAAIPAGRPAVLVVGARSLGGESGDAHFVQGALPENALDLDPFDVVAWVAGAPATGLEDPGAAEVAASFARRGGLLVGPAPPTPWPEALARRLGPPVEETGVRSSRPHGAGRVARAESRADLDALLAAGHHVPRVATAFDRALAPPPVGEEWGAPPAAPPRGPTGALLGVFAGAAAVATLLAGWRRGLALLVLSALASVGIAALSPRAGALALEAFRVDVGGAGGRRVEGLLVTAGGAGWTQAEGEGVVGAREGLRLLGFRRVAEDPSRLALPAGGRGWVVEESVAGDPAPGLEVVRRVPSWARGLVAWHGLDPAEARLRAGLVAYAGPRLSGVPAPTTARALSLVP